MNISSLKILTFLTLLMLLFTAGCSGIKPLIDKGKDLVVLIGDENTKIKVKKQQLKSLEESLKTEESKWFISRDSSKIASYISDIRKYALDIIAESDQNDSNIIKLKALIDEIDKETPWYAGLFSSYEVSVSVPGVGSARIKKGEESKTLKSMTEDIGKAKSRVEVQLGEVKTSMGEIKIISEDLVDYTDTLASLVAERVGDAPELDAEIASVLALMGKQIDELEQPTFTAFASTLSHDFSQLVSAGEALAEVLSSFVVTPNSQGKFDLVGYVSLPPLGDIHAGDIITLKFPEGFELAQPVDVVTSLGLDVTVLGNTTCSDALSFIVESTYNFGNNDIRLGFNGFDVAKGSTLRNVQYFSSRQGGLQSFHLHVIAENTGAQTAFCEMVIDRPIGPIKLSNGTSDNIVIGNPVSPSHARVSLQ